MRKIIIAVIALCCAGLAYSKPVKDNLDLLDRTVKQVQKIYRSSGISGVGVEVDQCYRSSGSNKLKCFYMDYTGRTIDALMISAIKEQTGVDNENFTQSPYFEDDQFYPRIAKYVYVPNDSSMDEANNHLTYIHDRILDILDSR